MIDTPLLVNIKGCGYPPEVACERFASDYESLLNATQTFPCYYSRVNPWVVIEVYNYGKLNQSTQLIHRKIVFKIFHFQI